MTIDYRGPENTEETELQFRRRQVVMLRSALRRHRVASWVLLMMVATLVGFLAFLP